MHFPQGMHEMNYGRDVGGLAPDSLIFLQRFHSGEANMSDIPIPVSYTHLTLPTIGG